MFAIISLFLAQAFVEEKYFAIAAAVAIVADGFP